MFTVAHSSKCHLRTIAPPSHHELHNHKPPKTTLQKEAGQDRLTEGVLPPKNGNRPSNAVDQVLSATGNRVKRQRAISRLRGKVRKMPM